MQIEELNRLFPNKILPYEYPKPYPNKDFNPTLVKAIVLGCDPSNFSNNGETSQLETVFGIEGVGKDGRYFTGILKNLNEVGLKLTDIYVQNLCRNYFYKETKKNDIWYDAAAHWRKTLNEELNQLGIPQSVPVFLTAEELYRALVNEKHTARQCKEFYQTPELIPIEPSENYLERPLVPLFRGGAGYYNLKNWENYRNRIVELLDNSKN